MKAVTAAILNVELGKMELSSFGVKVGEEPVSHLREEKGSICHSSCS
jgi:hypothetical protein